MAIKKGYQGYLLIYSLWAMVATLMVIILEKYALHVMLNTFHDSNSNAIFKTITFLGDGLFVTIIAIVLLFYNYGAAFLVAVSGILSGLSSQLLKHQVFSEYHRPSEYLDQMPDLALVPLLEMKHYFSFPSGHSTAAFALFFALALLSRKWYSGALLGLIAVLVGYSRVFLSQHFLEDVLAGSLLGMFCSATAFFMLNRINGRWKKRSLRDLFNSD